MASWKRGWKGKNKQHNLILLLILFQTSEQDGYQVDVALEQVFREIRGLVGDLLHPLQAQFFKDEVQRVAGQVGRGL